MSQEMQRSTARNRAMTTAILFLILSVGILAVVVYLILRHPGKGIRKVVSDPQYSINGEEPVVAFSSEQDFQEYLSAAEESSRGSGMFMGSVGIPAPMPLSVPEFSTFQDRAGEFAIPEAAIGQPAADRFSTTNVQIAGIDEPDIVKTDGTHLYTSLQQVYFAPRPLILEDVRIPDIYVPPQPQDATQIVRAFPPDQLAKRGSIDEQGNLLIVNDTLVVVGSSALSGYNVSNPALPVESWNVDFNDGHFLHAARLYGNTIYIVMQASINRPRPCPFTPVSLQTGIDITVRCPDIYHPVAPVPVDVTYTVVSINAETGQVTDTVSFVGSSGSSVVFMSHEAVYVTYSYYKPYAEIVTGFFDEEGEGLIPESVFARIDRVQKYELSSRAKLVEIETIINDYYDTLDQDERRRMEVETENRMKRYTSRHSREFETTGIVKVSRRDLTVQETGSVPGRPLNQFSLDEYEGNIRIATTMGNMFFGSRENSVSDVYILDSSMRIAGSVSDLGRGERIYAVRFVGDRGYVVTFRETDPFYVLDLSRPRRPQLLGELKIPGYSSYLHPLTQTNILGIGKEGSQVKLSLFDVSDPASPREADKYILDEYWSDILTTHHAFLLDSKHGVFFVPGAAGGYIFSYGGNTLGLLKAVDVPQAKRAVFIDDYLYIIAEQEIVVLDETTWERAADLNL